MEATTRERIKVSFKLDELEVKTIFCIEDARDSETSPKGKPVDKEESKSKALAERFVGGLVISGVNSGVGKTTISAGICKALQRKGFVVQPFKVGPDFLDGKHLQSAAKTSTESSEYTSKFSLQSRPCINLDGWLMGGKEQCISAFHSALLSSSPNESGLEPIIAVIEGCMGLYDGRDGRSDAGSTAEIAKWLNLPVILVLDCSATARSAAAMLKGFQVFDAEVRLEATVLNRVHMSESEVSKLLAKDTTYLEQCEQDCNAHLMWLKEAIGNDAIVLGAIPLTDKIKMAERHLGLKLPQECNTLDTIGDLVGQCLDFDKLIGVASRAEVPWPSIEIRESALQNVKIGIAFDEAFCFYYHDNLVMLKEFGAELVSFSPIHDHGIPDGVQALYIGGGYPELHANLLEENVAMRESISLFSSAGGVIYAECGGLMYLSKCIEVENDQHHEMVGIFPFKTRMTKTASLGYISITTSRESVIFPPNANVRGQIFHFSEIVEERVIGSLCPSTNSFDSETSSQRGNINSANDVNYSEIYCAELVGISTSKSKASEGYCNNKSLASFIHVHFRSNPEFASHFLDICKTVDPKLAVLISSRLANSVSRASNAHANAKLSPNGHNRSFSAESMNRLEDTPYHRPKNGLYQFRSGSPSSSTISDITSRSAVSSKKSWKMKRGRDLRVSYSHGDLSGFENFLNDSEDEGSSVLKSNFGHISNEEAICCFSPQATEMVCALGLSHRLVAVTELCDYPHDIQKGRHIVCKSKVRVWQDGNSISSDPPSNHVTSHSTGNRTDSALRELKSRKEEAFVVDIPWLSIMKPGIVITQDTCRACSADGNTTVKEALIEAGLMDRRTNLCFDCKVLNLKAYIFSDMFEHLLEIGAATGVDMDAISLVKDMRARLRRIVSQVSAAEYRPSVVSFEGLSPLVIGGHWLPEMKKLAGGEDPLQEPGAAAQRVHWQKVRRCSPEVLILTPCSYSTSNTLSEVSILASMPGWWSLPAVHRGEVYIIDHAPFSRPGPRLIDGVEILAHLLHPMLVPRPRLPINILKLTLVNGQRCNPKQLANYFKPYV